MKNLKYVKFTNEIKYINDFIELKDKLYDSFNNTEDKKELKQILKETHILSKYFNIDKFLIYLEDEVVARFIITTYNNDNIAYLGFFECINDKEVAKFLFDTVDNFVRNKGFKKIIGPVDASFWFKYRLKINYFENKPYTSEPYNRKYYFKLFKDNGYEIVEHYISNKYNVPEEYEIAPKFKKRYNDFINKGYIIKEPKIKEFNDIVEEIYYLITDLYSDFPMYKDISLEDFVLLTNNLKIIAEPGLIKLIYFENKIVGFLIGLPNYNNLIYNIKFKNIFKIFNLKKEPEENLMMFMGVDKKHVGLGSVLVYVIVEEALKRQIPCIGSLARDGKITQNYLKEQIIETYEYVLLEKDL